MRIKHRNIRKLTNQAPWVKGVGLTAQWTDNWRPHSLLKSEPIGHCSFYCSRVSTKHQLPLTISRLLALTPLCFLSLSKGKVPKKVLYSAAHLSLLTFTVHIRILLIVGRCPFSMISDSPVLFLYMYRHKNMHICTLYMPNHIFSIYIICIDMYIACYYP